MPVFAAIPAVLGAIGAGAGVTGAGITAGMSIAAGAGIVGAAAGIGSQLISAASQKKAATMDNLNAASNPSTTVGDPSVNSTSQANNLGRAALISTSPQGVLGTDATGRKKLLSADS